MTAMTAIQAWQRLCVDKTGEKLTAEPYYGTFREFRGGIIFGCGEGCCDNQWETEEEFLQFAEGSTFKVKTNE